MILKLNKNIISLRKARLFIKKRYFSDKPKDDIIHHIEELQETIIKEKEKESLSLIPEMKYRFLEKTIAFIVDQPVLIYKPFIISIGNKKIELLKNLLKHNRNLFATAILPKNLESEYIDKLLSIEINENDYLDKINDKNENINQDNNFFNIASYCYLEIIDDTKISLKYLHKAKLNSIIKYPLIPDASNIDLSSYFEENNENLEKQILKKELEDDTEPKFKSLSEDILTSSSLTRKSSNKNKNAIRMKFQIPDTMIHISENTPLEGFNYFTLSLELRTKIDYLIDYANKIMFQNSQEKVMYINYNDLDSLFEAISSYLNNLKFFKYEEILSIFQSVNIEKSVDICLELMQRYMLFLQKMQSVGKMAEQNLQMKKNKEYYNEVYSVIKKMAENEKDSPVAKLQAEFKKKNPSNSIQEIFYENLSRLATLDKNNPEFALQKNFLEWMSSIPYGIRSNDTFDMNEAKRILDESHYGLTNVKNKILEFISVGKLSGSLKGKILCLEGPPGVGKTSFAFSIAKALSRKVYRVSLGGESDVSVLKGHRKTYTGSRPGKIIAALKDTQTENCVIILDEIDKIGKSNIFGDPQSCLLEILDPEQNSQFTDNYLDYPVDLSNILFICTANNIGNISAPLRDRMDIINITSYTNSEKKEIFNKYLLPRAFEETGMKKKLDVFTLEDGIIDKILFYYCRESGIRSLQKFTNKLFEKLAYQILEKEENLAINSIVEYDDNNKIVVNASNLEKYLGQPVFDKEIIYCENVAGVVKGLAYNEVGGSVLFLEASICSLKKYSKGLKFTGTLGDVMKESIRIAYSFTRLFLSKKENFFLEQFSVHIHVPEGATPKDGPSAGITIASALISLALQKPSRTDFAMTGEISLKGKVLKIGGIKEKILAAKREKVFNIICPIDNKEDVEILEPEILEGMNVHFAQTYEDVYKLLFE